MMLSQTAGNKKVRGRTNLQSRNVHTRYCEYRQICSNVEGRTYWHTDRRLPHEIRLKCFIKNMKFSFRSRLSSSKVLRLSWFLYIHLQHPKHFLSPCSLITGTCTEQEYSCHQRTQQEYSCHQRTEQEYSCHQRTEQEYSCHQRTEQEYSCHQRTQ